MFHLLLFFLSSSNLLIQTGPVKSTKLQTETGAVTSVHLLVVWLNRYRLAISQGNWTLELVQKQFPGHAVGASHTTPEKKKKPVSNACYIRRSTCTGLA